MFYNTQKNEVRQCKNLFKYIGTVIEQVDIYIYKNVTFVNL